MLAGHSRITSGDRFSLDSLFVDFFFFGNYIDNRLNFTVY